MGSPFEIELLEPTDPYPPLCQGLKEIDRFLVSRIARTVSKNDLDTYFANMGNAEVADVQFSLKAGIAMVIFDYRTGRNMFVCG